jgi:hypothetical protein
MPETDEECQEFCVDMKFATMWTKPDKYGCQCWAECLKEKKVKPHEATKFFQAVAFCGTVRVKEIAKEMKESLRTLYEMQMEKRCKVSESNMSLLPTHDGDLHFCKLDKVKNISDEMTSYRKTQQQAEEALNCTVAKKDQPRLPQITWCKISKMRRALDKMGRKSSAKDRVEKAEKELACKCLVSDRDILHKE